MGVEDAKNTDGAQGTDAANTAAGTTTQTLEQAQAQIANLNIALGKERDKAAGFKTTIDATTTAKAAADEADAIKRGEFEQLHTAEKTRADALQVQLAALNLREEGRLEGVTAQADAIVAGWEDTDKALDPKGLTPDARLAHLQALNTRFTGQKTRPAGTRVAGGDATAPAPDFVVNDYKERFQRDPTPEQAKGWEKHLRNTPKFKSKFESK